MSQPWVFQPNCAGNIWLNQSPFSAPPSTPIDYAFVECQLMRPQIQVNHPLGVKVLHRFIFRINQTRPWNTVDLFNGVVIQLEDSNPYINEWYSALERSWFPYKDPATGDYVTDVIMLYCQDIFYP